MRKERATAAKAPTNAPRKGTPAPVDARPGEPSAPVAGSPAVPDSPPAELPANPLPGVSMNPVEALALSRANDQALSKRSEKQRIKGFPKNSKVRKAAAQIMAMKIAGHTNEEIGKALLLSPRTLRQYLYIAGQNGWLRMTDPEEDLEFRIAHKVVRNVEATLDGTLIPNPSMQEMTIAAAKGIGLFKSGAEKAAAVTPTMALQVNIVGAPGTVDAIPGQSARPEAFGGTPAYIEGEVTE